MREVAVGTMEGWNASLKHRDDVTPKHRPQRKNQVVLVKIHQN